MTELMPAAFLGHGNPMNALDDNDYTRAWRAFGQAAPKPRAILVVSAHWYVNVTAITSMAKPKTIHDFFGFPDELFAVQYPAPGDPELAQEIADLVKPTWVGLDQDSWGIDHGAWSVLVHAFPDADVPVLQLAINAQKPYEHHLELGAQLAPLRQRGVLIVASGNVVHNLRAIDWSQPETGYGWARRFNEAVLEQMRTAPGGTVALAAHPDHANAVPTPDHFLPLLYLAGLAEAADSTASVLVDGYAYGSLSMTAFTLDGIRPEIPEVASPAAPLPEWTVEPPDEANI